MPASPSSPIASLSAAPAGLSTQQLAAGLPTALAMARTDRSVCYVVPTRSLGREVRRAMSNRVRVLQKEIAAEQADFSSMWGLFDPAITDEPGNRGADLSRARMPTAGDVSAERGPR